MDDTLYTGEFPEPVTEKLIQAAKEAGKRYLQETVLMLKMEGQLIQEVTPILLPIIKLSILKVVSDLEQLNKNPDDILGNPDSALIRVMHGKTATTYQDHKDLMSYINGENDSND